MGPSAFSAQYQQDPTPPGGNRVRWEWFAPSPEGLTRENCLWVAQSWDTGLTAEPTSDFSVGMTWGFYQDRWHLLDIERARFDFPELKQRVQALATRWGSDLVLIEYAGSGISLLQQLRQEDRQGWRYQGSKPKLDKRTRLEAQTARLETGRYALPNDAPWLSEAQTGVVGFPERQV